MRACVLARLLARSLACLLNNLLTYLPAYLLAYIHTHLLTCCCLVTYTYIRAYRQTKRRKDRPSDGQKGGVAQVHLVFRVSDNSNNPYFHLPGLYLTQPAPSMDLSDTPISAFFSEGKPKTMRISQPLGPKRNPKPETQSQAFKTSTRLREAPQVQSEQSLSSFILREELRVKGLGL